MTNHEITIADWDAYEWIRVSTIGDKQPVYIRGKKRVDQPHDGYYYERCDTAVDSEYKWSRVIAQE